MAREHPGAGERRRACRRPLGERGDHSADLCFGLADPDGQPLPATPEEERFHDSVREHKRAVLRRAIAKAGGNKTKAAEILGLTPTYLFRLIRVLGIEG